MKLRGKLTVGLLGLVALGAGCAGSSAANASPSPSSKPQVPQTHFQVISRWVGVYEPNGDGTLDLEVVRVNSDRCALLGFDGYKDTISVSTYPAGINGEC